ncbi:hypothetical protein G6N05_05635 [Flavobacterium sp. F372]|jgi:predicted CopG family antitoxin|uniref:Uncharacterized protein n=1 Tax=Flavobacterium bernardetii TaxID=2813823 RepID=A0ABR7J2B6_9FLAO|nr:hypothetical protein [Flavobacterium bernardetii]MBC5835862.1 hypothetical protein [Flavobacterium bernardetii]NHF69592.1 hypothetical protein [Flavobacterium bernardetii]
MNEIIKLESEFRRIENIYLEKRKAISADESNHFTITLSYSELSKKFIENETKGIVDFANNLINNANDENVEKEINSKTELFLTEFALSLIYS